MMRRKMRMEEELLKWKMMMKKRRKMTQTVKEDSGEEWGRRRTKRYSPWGNNEITILIDIFNTQFINDDEHAESVGEEENHAANDF
jgi:hypothetical protein